MDREKKKVDVIVKLKHTHVHTHAHTYILTTEPALPFPVDIQGCSEPSRRPEAALTVLSASHHDNFHCWMLSGGTGPLEGREGRESVLFDCDLVII